MKRLITFIRNYEVPSLSQTIVNHYRQILVLGMLPSGLSYAFFSRQKFIEFSEHHLLFLNNWPYLFISLIIYLMGFGWAYYKGHSSIESEFRALFQSVIGILFFLFIISFICIFKNLSYEPKQSLYYLIISFVLISECYGLFVPLRLMDKYEGELLCHNYSKNKV